MEFLVTMTTRVPDGTRAEDVDDVRGREAEHSRELAAQGHLLRLWRPPLQPGEWRTLGLFVADDRGQLERVLASMPLRVWRADEVVPLSPHPNDPAHAGDGTTREFLTTFTITIPEGTPAQDVDGAELARQGHLSRLWKLPGEGRALGLWQAQDDDEMSAILASLPLSPWMTVKTVPLSVHPSDPGRAGVGA